MSVERKELKDEAGNYVPVIEYDGDYYPPIVPQPEVRFPAIKTMEGKDDDVLIVTCPKTGTNWTTEMLMMLKQNNAEVGWGMMTRFLEHSPDFSVVTSQPEPRLFGTHLTANRLSESLLKKSKIVLVCRNPKDQVVSFMYHLKRTSGDAYAVPYGSYIDFYLSWEAALKKNGYNYMLVYYEDFHTDFMGNLKKLNNFLGYNRSDELLQKIAVKCTMKNMSAEKRALSTENMLIKKVATDGHLLCFRKGVIGDWKNHFTVAQSEAFDKLIEEKLGDSMYSFLYDMPHLISETSNQ